MPHAESKNQRQEGPWLDRLFPIHLPGGRMVSVTSFAVLPSNIGILEGGLNPKANATQRERVLSIAAEGHGKPVVVVEPVITSLPSISSPGSPRERLPWMACIARLTSAPVDSYMESSELTLVWWLDAFDGPLPLELERAAAGVDWGKSARDVDFL
jgi:hypothetical protein